MTNFFIKYPSLENLYSINTSMLNSSDNVILYEKLDGSNCSLCIRNNEHRFASRNQLTESKWNDLDKLIPIEFIKKVKEKYKNINLYGEVFSDKILKRIPYNKPRVLFYDAIINEKMITQKEFEELKKEINYPEMFLEPLSITTLGNAITFDIENFYSKFTDEKCIAEGIVIKGYEKFIIYNSHILMIKNKSKQFSEKKSIKTTNQNNFKYENFLSYINENRLLSVISKEGEPNTKNMGNFIKLIITDAIDDYIKDGNTLDDKEIKNIRKLYSKNIVILIQQRINSI